MNHISFSRIIRAWLIVGTLDYLAATIQVTIKTGRNFFDVFQSIGKYIAGAVVGPDTSKTGGAGMVIAGVAFHYINALLFTVFFFLIFSTIEAGIIKKLFIGIIYGAFVWFVMNRIVVPLTAIGVRPTTPTNDIIAAGILMVCIGIPLSLMVIKTDRR